jgi:hypothetical protein
MTDSDQVESSAESYYEESDSEPEVTLNILERQPRITAGKRLGQITSQEAEKDKSFWGSEKHRTWEESESDSEVEYTLDASNESDLSISDSEDGDLEHGEEEEEEDDEDIGQRKKRPVKGYVDRRDAVPESKKRSSHKKPVVSEGVPASVAHPAERRETRDTTRRLTIEMEERAATATSVPRRVTPSATRVKRKFTQEEMLEEAKTTEYWNTADLNEYMRITASLEATKNLSRSRRIVPRGSHIIKWKSTREGESLTIIPPADAKGVMGRPTSEILGIDPAPVYDAPGGRGWRYRTTGGDFFNNSDEFKKIRNKSKNLEIEEISQIIQNLKNSLIS